jgi:glycosyltransferase involved in cell wall biosynthesis
MVLLMEVTKKDIVYVNTILPFGAAIAGRIKGARVIYHIHETSVNPEIFKQFLLFWVKACATEVIYVSDFLANEEPLNKPSHILWNAIEDDFRNKAEAHHSHGGQHSNVLMIASLKRYKGVDEYVEISRASPQLHFDLVVNASQKDIEEYFLDQVLPPNLTVYPAQQDIHPFYQRADVVMNLSRPEEWKETFGLTALEAMIYGLPVIVPPVGGIAEIVKDGLTGFHINGKYTNAITSCLRRLNSNPAHYQSISRRAAAHAATFSESPFIARSLRIIEKGSYS